MDSKTLLSQIGTANLMAVGARNFVSSETSLMFEVGATKRNHLRKLVITLNPSDTYDVRFVEMKKPACNVTLEIEESGIYDDSIGAVVRRLGDR